MTDGLRSTEVITLSRKLKSIGEVGGSSVVATTSSVPTGNWASFINSFRRSLAVRAAFRALMSVDLRCSTVATASE